VDLLYTFGQQIVGAIASRELRRACGRMKRNAQLDRIRMESRVLIDAHHHLWKYNEQDYAWMSDDALRPLRRDFLTVDLMEATRSSDVRGAIAVQVRQSLLETEWLLEIAARNSLVLGVVGWVPLCSPEVNSILERFAHDQKLKGVRHIVQDEPDNDFMLRVDFNRGVALLKDFGFAYDILIFERHLAQAIEFVDRHPQQVFVVDHVAKPRIKENLISPWEERIRELAKRENVYCKVSGMVTEADWSGWSVQQLRPYFDVVLSAFGSCRLMFGSDWPVLTLAGDYDSWVHTFQSFIAELSPAEQTRISSGTARELYRV
jgi:L-fuconolactonase